MNNNSIARYGITLVPISDGDKRGAVVGWKLAV